MRRDPDARYGPYDGRGGVPRWPSVVREDRPRSARRNVPEPWEEEAESYAGAKVLEDLVFVAGDVRETAGVLARFAALRLVLRAAAGEVGGVDLMDERTGTARYMAVPGALGSAERRALSDVVLMASRNPERAIATRLVDAGKEAQRRGAKRGAFALMRSAYALALSRGWTLEAARAAAAIAQLAEDEEGVRSTRRWRRRAGILARRARRERAERREAAGGGEG